MSSYTFGDRRIMEFLEAIEKGTPIDKLEIKAEKVRIAKINLIKSKLALFRLKDREDVRIDSIKFKDKLHQDFLNWGNISFDEIVDYCESVDYCEK